MAALLLLCWPRRLQGAGGAADAFVN